MASLVRPIELLQTDEMTKGRVSSPVPGDVRVQSGSDPRIRTLALNQAILEERRIVSHGASLASKSFDMLRAHVLKEMDRNGFQFLAVTSPTPRCGKSTIACNLALSLSRIPDRAPILVDMDLRKPSVARYLGLRCAVGLVDVLRGTAHIHDAMINVTVGSASLIVLPGVGEASHPADWIESQMMADLLQSLRHNYGNRTVIFDMPSILDNDDVISILPKMDATVLVAASATSTIEDIQSCRHHLGEIPVLRVVVNKVPPSKVGEGKY